MKKYSGKEKMIYGVRRGAISVQMIIIYVDNGKPSRNQILEQLFNPMIVPFDDESAFELYLLRKWII